MIVLSFLWDTFKLILKLPVLLCLGIIYSVVGMIRGIYSIFHAFYWVFLTLACNDTMDKYRVSHKINSTLKTYRLDSYFLSYHLKDIYNIQAQMVKVPIWAYYCMNSCVQPEQDPPVYYSIVILTILYYLRVADLDWDYVPIPT